MNLRFVRLAALCLLQTTVLFGPVQNARAADADRPVVLVATEVLDPSVFRQTVVLAVPARDGTHFGFVLNLPTEASLAELFPEDQASQRTSAHVNFGGPFLTDTVFALVRGHAGPGQSTIEVTPELFVALDGSAVDRVIADRPDDAHFFAGLLAWRAGELTAQLRVGAWEVLDPEPDLVLGSDASGMWSRLNGLAHAMRASWTGLRNCPTDVARSRGRMSSEIPPTHWRDMSSQHCNRPAASSS
jgi:putative AlgH/UPF0301 family transcriptional regulator